MTTTRLSSFISGLMIITVITACQKYRVSVNDKVVYTPDGVFKDYQISDQYLADCVEQTIYDLHATRIEDITQLNCSNAGITSLAGLGKFYELKALNLADNKLTDISEIRKLGRLKTLILSNNQISDASPLLNLLHLQDVHLEKNPQMSCAPMVQLGNNLKPLGASILLPEQCVR